MNSYQQQTLLFACSTLSAPIVLAQTSFPSEIQCPYLSCAHRAHNIAALWSV